MASKRRTGGFLLGAIAGGALGVAVGFLIAPQEGRKFRRRLSFKLEQLSKNMVEFIDELGQLEDVSEARRTGDQVIASARERAEPILNDINARLEEVRRRRAESSSS